jgi:hypothetical protein
MQIDDSMVPWHLTVSDIQDDEGEDLPNSLLDKISEEGNFDVFTKEDSIDKWDMFERPRNTSPFINFGEEREIFEKTLHDGALVQGGNSSSEKMINISPIEKRHSNNTKFMDLNMIGNDRALRRRDSSDEESNTAQIEGRHSNSNLIRIKEDSEEEDEAQSEGLINELIIHKAINLTSSLYLKSDYKASPEQRSHPLKDRHKEDNSNWVRAQSNKLSLPLQSKPRLSATLTSKQQAKKNAEKPIHINLGASATEINYDLGKKVARSPKPATSKDKNKIQVSNQDPKCDLRSSQFSTVSNKNRHTGPQMLEHTQHSTASPMKQIVSTRKTQHQSAGQSSIKNPLHPKNRELFCRRPFIEINKSKGAAKNSPRIPICSAFNLKTINPNPKDSKDLPEQEITPVESQVTANNIHTSLYETQALSTSQCIAATPLTINTQSASSSRLSQTGIQLDKYSFNKSHNDIKSRLEKSTTSRGVASITTYNQGTGYDNLYEKRKQFANRVVNNHPLYLTSYDRRNKNEKKTPLETSNDQPAQTAAASQNLCKSFRKPSVRSYYSSAKKNNFVRNGESNSPKQSESKPKFAHYFNMFQKDSLQTQSIYDRVTPEDEDQSTELFKEKNAIYAKKAADKNHASSSSNDKSQVIQMIVPINLTLQPRFGSAAVKVDSGRNINREANPSTEKTEKQLKDSEDQR